MSFFADILAGAVAGGAGGYIKDQGEEEKRYQQLALKQMQFDQQRAMQEDRQMFQQQLLAERMANKAAGSGGPKDFNLAQMVYSDVLKQTSDPYAALEASAAVTGGDAARSQMRYVLRGQQAGGGGDGGYGANMPTEQDVLASMATDGKTYTPEPPKNQTRGQREAVAGEQALRHAFAIAFDPGKFDDLTKGERQDFQNAMGTQAFVSAVKSGKPIEDAGGVFNRLTNTAPFDLDGSAKTKRLEDSTNATIYKSDRAAEVAESNRISAEIRAMERDITALTKAPLGEMPEDKEARLARKKGLEDEVKSLRAGRLEVAQPLRSPAAQKTGRTTGGAIVRPLDAIKSAGY